MPVKWTKPKGSATGKMPVAPAEKPKADKPKANKPKANKPPKVNKPNGEKEAK